MMAARKVLDPKHETLHGEMAIFIKQEVQHCKLHQAFNKHLVDAGYVEMLPIEAEYKADYERFLKERSLRFNIVYAEGFELMGCAAAQVFFEDLDEFLDGADPRAADLWLAINTLGAISVPVNTAYKGEFLRHLAHDAAAALVIAESDYAERVVQIAEGLPTLRNLVYCGARPESLGNRLAGFGGQALPWAELVFDDTTDPVVAVKPGDLAMLIYTGGTTGLSKGCMVSLNYACNLARQMVALTARTKDTLTWTPLPLFHFNAVASTVLCNMLVGAGMAIYQRFSVSHFWPRSSAPAPPIAPCSAPC
jgi:carnitine-CoA ligase